MAGQDLTGRTAVVTGGSRGIGLAIARALCGAGANVVLTSRHQEAADAAAATVTGTAVGCAAHAVDEDAARRCVEFAAARFGSVDILVNNAATNPSYGPMVNEDRARFTKTFDLNVWAPLMWTALVAEAWMADHGGSVVNIASIGGLSVEPNLGTYNLTKAALVHLTKQLAFELSPKIRVNAVAPGVVRTRFAEKLWRDREDSLSASVPLGRMGEPDDVGSVVLFLASDAAGWITGETLLVDGGTLLGDAAAR